MGAVGTAPPMSGANVGQVIEVGGKILSNGTKVATGALGPIIVGLGAIFASQSLGGGTDMVKTFPEATGKPQEGGLNNPGIMMGGKTQSQSQSKAEEKDATCTADNPNCKDKDFHRGAIQAQEANGMLVIIPAGHNWFTEYPPSFGRLVFAVGIVRAGLEAQRPSVASNKALKLIGGDRGNPFQEGADIAATNLIAFLNVNKANAVTKMYRSFYFDGRRKTGKDGITTGPKSRRIDIDVEKGEIMGARAR